MGTEQSTLFLGSVQDRLKDAGNKSRCLLKEGVRVVWAAIKGEWTVVVSPKEKEWDETKWKCPFLKELSFDGSRRAWEKSGTSHPPTESLTKRSK